ncbi:MAG: 3-hydroxyacyl-CoA dehydrogenase NAD-binding domain-containing protein, partial [bacterium]|nr:3-hydroxyacyl-CoA dehydrogenase NAD-binding domain-containing protein [bacterium]
MMKEISRIGVIGSGQMGAGIAQVSAMSGYETLIWDVSKDNLTENVKGIFSQLNKMVEKGKLTAIQSEAAKALLFAGNTMQDFASCDLVVEAATENFQVKAEIFKNLDETLKPEGILASNTSSISITKIAATTKRPSQVIGMHFMNPVPLMKLVELIRGIQTNDETYNA